MDPQAGGSFIPKKPLVETRSVSFGGGLIFSIALLVFLASAGAAGAVFAYQGILKSSIASKDADLKQTEEAFDPDAIDTLIRTDRRIQEVRGLLGKHAAPSAIFALLSELTLLSVRYESFSYELDLDGAAKITLDGMADSFSSVALQSDEFGRSRHLSNVVFSGININSTGKVDFSVDATVAPSTLSYAKQQLDPAQSLVPQIHESPAPAATSSAPASGGRAATTTTP